jgi:hypothetical protein
MVTTITLSLLERSVEGERRSPEPNGGVSVNRYYSLGQAHVLCGRGGDFFYLFLPYFFGNDTHISFKRSSRRATAARRRFDSGMCVTTAFAFRQILPKKNNDIQTA